MWQCPDLALADGLGFGRANSRPRSMVFNGLQNGHGGCSMWLAVQLVGWVLRTHPLHAAAAKGGFEEPTLHFGYLMISIS